MKKLLATSAIALVALSGAASAQSVLERVLGQIDNATNLASVNGTFANIAENIGGSTVMYTDTAGNSYTEAEWAAAQIDIAQDTFSDVYTTAGSTDVYLNPETGETLTPAQATTNLGTSADIAAAGFVLVDGTGQYFQGNAASDAEGLTLTNAAHTALDASYTAPTLDATVMVPLAEGIDGSITNLVDGIDQATQEAVASAGVSATEWNMPTLNFGDMATTALGAVNTGDITLGVNSAIDEASTSTTNALSSVMNQIGGSADTGAIVINVASNMTGVNGSITNTMNEVNGTIGALSTTALGAVNTGTIVSGIDGVITGITGSSSGQQTLP
ncbi:hypothetical protein [Nioella sp.]|uniref:hypothetical protein n=1 Tax=Nioella sp. TaxID=1912091 RepID=UPI003A85E4DA